MNPENTSVTLLFDWKYKAYGTHHKKCYEYPLEMSGRSKQTFIVEKNQPLTDQLKLIKQKMVSYVKSSNHDGVKRYWGEHYGYDDEEIGRESVTIYNVREATKWSDLDDY